MLAEVLHVDEVAGDSNFFEELGADSLVMAHFCARVRKRGDLPQVSMRDVYKYPTVGALADALAAPAPAPAPAPTPQTTRSSATTELTEASGIAETTQTTATTATTQITEPTEPSRTTKPTKPTANNTPTAAPAKATTATTATAADTSAPPAKPDPPPRTPPTGTPHYLLCGALQLLAFLGYSCVVAVVAVQGYEWISAGAGAVEAYLRAVVVGTGAFLALCGLPIAVKWLLVGRWKPREIRVWSLDYVRFWTVKTLVRSNPLVLFVGSPLYVLYLRALGARVGKGVSVFTRNLPVCTDLLTVGAGTVIRKDSFLSCYRAQDGVIQTGAVVLGRDAVVSEATVLDIGTAMGDRAQLGHASSLHRGQAVPDGEHWHGSPAQRGETDFLPLGPAECGTRRRALHSLLQLLAALLVYVPLAVGGAGILLAQVPQLDAALEPGATALTGWVFYGEALAASLLLFFGTTLLGVLLVATLPRLLGRTVRPGRVYPLYGYHYAAHRLVMLATNRRFLTRLFGDSSGIVHYLRYLGYDLSRVQQTGSNFGTDVRHETPYLSTVGTGTMVADGLSIANADFSSSSFRVAPVAIGPRNFLGNRITYPTRGRTGENCLLATKVMVPVDGPVREGVGLLGSPAFEIPRSVQRDSSFDRLKSGEELDRLLPAKNRHNAATMALYLLVRWLHFFGITLLVSGAAELYTAFGALAIALGNVLVVLFTAVYYVLVERIVTARHALRPLFCSIYDIRFWRRERYWKVPSETYLRLFNGTPYKNLVWRMLGVRIGRRVFDDGCSLTERTMVGIGDGCTLNAGSVVQCHSQEDGTFKSDRVAIGSGCTLGVGAFAHYGIALGDGAELAPDSFLMKGESVPRHALWGGNPARPFPQDADGERRQQP
ncbi:non-ribosomal peptide synthetase [Streptomyces albus]|uniref:Non-ribosomal peptide synthetase n=1 Tax=Streptomyces albus (strain ATCC 21838 / DSM 41398 / FERM P-419 / JCM 4703 / NBRC 107858) TaxID=1081613 RepID=A0A0B5F1G4_STRA4|nr:non-ribosomal peptide synthetase [Streptomyces albus]